MSVIVTTTLIAAEGTGNANEYKLRIKHVAAFPTGGTDAFGNPIVEVHGVEEIGVILTAADKPTLVALIKTRGNNWKSAVAAIIAARFQQLPASSSIGDSVSY